MRGQDGELRGFYNVCPHRAHELFEDERGNKRLHIFGERQVCVSCYQQVSFVETKGYQNS